MTSLWITVIDCQFILKNTKGHITVHCLFPLWVLKLQYLPVSVHTVFKIHGQIYHNVSHLHPHEVGQGKYAQFYVLNSDIALRQHMNKRENLQCKKEIMNKLDNVIS